MKPRELRNLGIPKGELTRLAGELIGRALGAGMKKAQVRARIRELVAAPAEHVDDPDFGTFAEALVAHEQAQDASPSRYVERETPAPWRQWGEDLEPQSVEQMANACRLPVAVAGALMADAHLGYGLPIGGVLATEGAVIPYAVGVDIACRMKLSVLDADPHLVRAEPDRLVNAIESETRFGLGARFDPKIVKMAPEGERAED